MPHLFIGLAYLCIQKRKIHGLPLVAHNKAFDENCLKVVFRSYQMDYPYYPFFCTLLKSRKVWSGGQHNLDVIAERCGYNLKIIIMHWLTQKHVQPLH